MNPIATPQNPVRRRVLAATLLSLGLALTGASLRAAAYTWDPTLVPATPAGGAGTWNLSLANWSNGTIDQAWIDTTGTADTATFRGTAGTVTVGSSLGALGLIFTTPSYTLATGTNTLTLGSSGINASALSSGTTTLTGLVVLGANQSWNVGSGSTLTSSAVISGSGGLTKSGAGTLTFNASNTYSGATTVNAGTLSLGSTSSPYTIANSDVTVNAGGTFTFGASTSSRNVTTTIAKSLTLNGGTAKLVGTFRSPTDQFTNNLTLASGDSVVAIDGAQNGGFGSALKFNGTLARTAGATVLFRGKNLGGDTNIDANNKNQPQDIYFATAPTLVGGGGSLASTTTSIIAYAIGDNGYLQGSLYLTSGLGTDFVSYNPTGGTGAGVQLLTTYATTITSGASALDNVKITDTSATGINAATTINSLILNSSTAATGSPGTTIVDGTGTLTINSGALMVTTTSAATSNGGSGGNYGGLFQNNASIGASGLTLDFGTNEAIITTVGSSTLTIESTSGGITGSGGLTKSGAGTLNLNAANTYTGTTTINAGTIVLGNSSALQNSTLNYNNQGGTLSFGTLTAATLGGLSGSQNLALINATSASVALTVGHNNITSTYSGVLSGGGSLIKTGTGTLTLTGVNTYTGGTTVNQGTLAYGANFTMNGANQISVAGAGTAGVDYATVTSTAGTLSFTGGTLQINVTASLSGSQSFALFQASGGTLSGDFTSVGIAGSYVTSLTDNDGIWTGAANGINFTFTDSTGILSTSAIPEPAAYAAIFGALTLGLVIVRRRKTALRS